MLFFQHYISLLFPYDSDILLIMLIILVYIICRVLFKLIQFLYLYATYTETAIHKKYVTITGMVNRYKEDLKTPLFLQKCYGYKSQVIKNSGNDSKIEYQDSEVIDFVLTTRNSKVLIKRFKPSKFRKIRMEPIIKFNTVNDATTAIYNKPKNYPSLYYAFREYLIKDQGYITLQGLYISSEAYPGVDGYIEDSRRYPIFIYQGNFKELFKKLKKNLVIIIIQMLIMVLLFCGLVYTINSYGYFKKIYQYYIQVR